MRPALVLTALLLCATPAARSDVRGCECIVESALTAGIRGCSLCMEAEKRPASEKVFTLKDSSPTKPNRWLVLPRASYDGANPLKQMPAEIRLELWSKAIAQGRELWGESWAVAMNSDRARTQCHLHVHVGKLLADQERPTGTYVNSPAELPVISDGGGLWFHPVGNRLHVHVGEDTPEFVLLK
jgi:diadenosine tetraphosphate (Ap4A) HIT family hydrolase